VVAELSWELWLSYPGLSRDTNQHISLILTYLTYPVDLTHGFPGSVDPLDIAVKFLYIPLYPTKTNPSGSQEIFY
jgi:hypothetical protein